ncbi:MAG: YraN family protein [bacterium]|nr:YraN family protein [bacterium]
MGIFNLFSRETDKRTSKRKTGDIGENIFVKHIVKHKYRVLDRNYLKKWGEIDIVAEKNGVIHFFEIKTVTHETENPEENVHFWKRKRLVRVIEIYLAEKHIPETTSWQVDVGAVFLDLAGGKHTIRITEDIDINE